MSEETYVVVGAGGTGSYLFNSLVHYLNVKRQKSNVILVDGDVLERRNLLRQGFIQKDIGKNKAKVLVERFSKITKENVQLEYRGTFIRSIEDVEEMASDSDKITIISCVDNNMARLRLLLAQYKIFFNKKRCVTFIDGGNAEWEGQTLVNKLDKNDEKPVIFDEEGIRFNDKSEHVPNIIFKEDWKDTLTVGDFEMSCDEIVEAAPQNILANMTSAMGIMRRVNDKKQVRYQFDTRIGMQEEFKVDKKGNEVLKEIVKYANGEGKKFLLKEHLEIEEETEEETEEEGTEEEEEESKAVDEETIEKYLDSF